MTRWEITDLFEMLKKAQTGDTKNLDQLIASCTPNCAVSNDLATMIIKRKLDSQNKSTKNSHIDIPSKSDTEQISSSANRWGITIIQLIEQQGKFASYYIPSKFKKARLRILDGDIIEIRSKKKTISGSIAEIERKLKSTNETWDQQEIQMAFDSISNQQYVLSIFETIENPILGTLELEEDEYNSLIDIDDNEVRVIISLTQEGSMSAMINYAEKFVSEKLYQKALKSMYSPMLEVKNEYWLSEEEDSDEVLTAIGLDEFKERITLNEIIFNPDETVTLICDADEMFGDQYIVIQSDIKGTYKDSMMNS